MDLNDRMLMESLALRLGERLRQPLPGRPSHLRMVPASRKSEFVEIPDDRRLSAVMLLLYPQGGKIFTVLIQRPEYQGHHSGQIALPGGKFEAGDRNLEMTAIREAQEEVGLQPSVYRIIGPLSPLYIPPSRFLMNPFLAWAPQRPELQPDPAEVESLIEVDIRAFCQENITEKEITLHDGRRVVMPYFDIDGRVIWGATSMVMSELMDIIAELR